jgi:Tfp pilus assembly protein PilO
MIVIGKTLIMSFEIIFKILIGAVLGYFMYKFKKMEDQAANAMDERKTRQLIEDKLESLKTQHKEVKEDLNRIEGKLDRLIEK